MTTPANRRRTRTDAARNRAHILGVAEQGFADEGVELAMDTIARRAGVGAGTLYRHFPTREALVAAVLEERYSDLERERLAIEEERDSLRALERWLDAVSVWMRAYEGLTGPLSLAHGNRTSPLAPTCQQVIGATEHFLGAAQRDGHARPGLRGHDLFMATLAVAWAAGATADAEAGAEAESGAEADTGARAGPEPGAGAGSGESGVRAILRSGWATS